MGLRKRACKWDCRSSRAGVGKVDDVRLVGMGLGYLEGVYNNAEIHVRERNISAE